MIEQECCGTCRWCHKVRYTENDWQCDNPESDNYTDLVDYSYHCGDYEERGK